MAAFPDLADHWRIAHLQWLARQNRKRQDRAVRQRQRSYGLTQRHAQKIQRNRKETP